MLSGHQVTFLETAVPRSIGTRHECQRLDWVRLPSMGSGRLVDLGCGAQRGLTRGHTPGGEHVARLACPLSGGEDLDQLGVVAIEQLGRTPVLERALALVLEDAVAIPARDQIPHLVELGARALKSQPGFTDMLTRCLLQGGDRVRDLVG